MFSKFKVFYQKWKTSVLKYKKNTVLRLLDLICLEFRMTAPSKRGNSKFIFQSRLLIAYTINEHYSRKPLSGRLGEVYTDSLPLLETMHMYIPYR